MLYEVLKTAKLGASFAPDMYTALWAQKLARDGEVKTLSGIPPLTFPSNGQPLLDYLISGNTVQSGTPTPDNPIMPVGTGDLETSGTKAGQYKIPISSANTTTPIYLGEVQTTRKVRKLVLTGEETWINNSNNACCVMYLQDVGLFTTINPLVRCSHFPTATSQSELYNRIVDYGITFGGSSADRICIRNKDTEPVADFKTYLAAQYAAGTPVTVWYVLAEPETGIVNEPLMKIGDYADTLSMEQAGVEIPTVRGINTLDVLTDVKPSEVYIKYKE